jgi:hypothetical protein
MKMKDAWRGDYHLPLMGELKAVIDNATLTADPWLFTAPRVNRPVRDASVEKLFRQYAAGQHSPHGTRASIRTFALEELGVRDIVSKALIDHQTSSGSDESYDKTQFFNERASIIADWCEKIAV